VCVRRRSPIRKKVSIIKTSSRIHVSLGAKYVNKVYFIIIQIKSYNNTKYLFA
jgi:hypothetical protein